MWCPHCQCEVAGTASPDRLRWACQTCGTEVPWPVAREGTAAHLDPQVLLARWSRGPILDPIGPLPIVPGVGAPRPATSPEAAASVPTPRHTDPLGRDEESVKTAPPAEPPRAVRETAPPEPPSLPLSPRESPVAEFRPLPPPPPWTTWTPAADLPWTADTADHRRPHQWVAVAGQILAYLGVATLTVGSVMVLVGYFGGPPHYAPYGWLVTTTGQMLLFLGVVTLVSVGLEQHNDEVSRRVERISRQLSHLERMTRAQCQWQNDVIGAAVNPASPERHGHPRRAA